MREVGHDAAVSPLSEADELVVLRDDLAGALAEVERERGLVGAEVVDVEDELFGEVLWVAPHHPADTGVHKPVFVAGGVDADDAGELEVPFELGVDKGRDEATGRSVDVDVAVEVALFEKVVNGFNVFVLASVGEAEDGADADCVFVDEIDGFFGVDDIAGGCAVDVLLFDVEVAGGFLPADLNGRVHDDVGFVVGLASGFALVLPSLFHGEDG